MLGRDDAPVDVLVEQGRIVAVVPAGTLDRGVTAGADHLDLDGRWVGPGLWDHHVHMTQWALARSRFDVAAATSAAAARALVADRLRAEPIQDGAVLVGYGFRDGLWPDEPTAELLDLGGAAVALVSADLHSVWINEPALRALGASSGSGLLREEQAFRVARALTERSEEGADALVADAAAAAAARGVVGIVDLEMEDAVGDWQRRYAAGFHGLRVRAGVYAHGLDAEIAGGRRSGSPIAGSGGLGEVGPLKVFADGSLNTRTAWCHAPYPEDGAHAGIAVYEPADLVALLRRGAAHGFVPAVHAIGDRANTQALDAMAAAGVRGTIEHAQLVDAADLPRFAALGVAASVQPEHAIDDRDVAERHWPGRTDRAYAFRSLLDAGAALALGSDAPVAPLDPWTAIAAAVFRTRGRPPWHPEQRIPLAAALEASTDLLARRSALHPGDHADLVVLDADPARQDDDGLRAMPVAGTLLAGRWTHRSGI